MSTLLDAIAAERADLLAPIADRLAVLAEMERLAAQLNGSAPDVPIDVPVPAPASKSRAPRAAPKPRTDPAGRDGLGPRSQRVLEALRTTNGWMARREVATAATMSAETVKHHLQLLVARGLIEAEGRTASRRYRAVGPAAPARKKTSFGKGPEAAAAKQDETLQGRIIDSVGYQPGSVDELAKRFKAPRADVVVACDQAANDGDIMVGEDGRYRSI